MSQLLLLPHIEEKKIFYGIDYATDYSLGWTSRSLVDRIYVDSLISGLSLEQIRQQKEDDIYNNELCQYILN